MRCATSSPIPTPAPCCPCSEQPPVRERGSPFFLFFREKKEGRFLFFLFFQKKKRKNQRKETLTGRDLRENFRAALPAALCVSGEGSVLSFPSGKERKNQRKETLTGRDLRANHRAALPAAFGSCFFLRGFSERKAPQNIFCGECAFRRRAGAAGQPKRVPGFLFGSFSFTERKRTKKPSGKKR